jgi:hypothetical protein
VRRQQQQQQQAVRQSYVSAAKVHSCPYGATVVTQHHGDRCLIWTEYIHSAIVDHIPLGSCRGCLALTGMPACACIAQRALHIFQCGLPCVHYPSGCTAGALAMLSMLKVQLCSMLSMLEVQLCSTS